MKKKIRRIVIETANDGELKIRIVEETYDLLAYCEAQKRWAREDPANRHGTRVEHRCPDENLTDHMLFEHFMQSGGAVWAGEHIRPLFVRITEVSPENGDCVVLQALSHITAGCKKCANCNLKTKE